VPTATQPDLSELSQKETVLWHLRNYPEIDRDVADEEYDIGRLAARIRDLKDDGYQFDTWKEDGIAHYSLVGEPVGDESRRESGPIDVSSVEDVLRVLPDDSLRHLYVRLLGKAARRGYPVGMLEKKVQAEALSDWEAAACIGRDVTVEAITEAREALCHDGPIVVADGSRKGQDLYRLHPELLE